MLDILETSFFSPNRSFSLSRSEKHKSKTMQCIKSRNCSAIGDFSRSYVYAFSQTSDILRNVLCKITEPSMEHVMRHVGGPAWAFPCLSLCFLLSVEVICCGLLPVKLRIQLKFEVRFKGIHKPCS